MDSHCDGSLPLPPASEHGEASAVGGFPEHSLTSTRRLWLAPYAANITLRASLLRAPISAYESESAAWAGLRPP
jgi:hypothetical protein